MQEKSFDKNQIIGFALMLVIFLGYFFYTQPSQEEIEAERAKQELAEKKEKQEQQQKQQVDNIVAVDSISQQSAKREINTFKLENDKILVEFSSLGAQTTQVRLKEYNAYDAVSENHEKPLNLINENNAKLSFIFQDKQGRTVDLSKRNFVGSKNGNTITFTTEEDGGILQYIYTLSGDYAVDFQIKSKNLSAITSGEQANLEFDLKALSQEKGKSWEERTTELYYSLDNYNKQDYSTSSYESEADETIDWVSFKQQFFSTILEKKDGMKDVVATVNMAENDSIHSKYFTFKTPISTKSELNEEFTWYFVPLEFNLLKDYDKGFHEIIPFGWGIFGWINEWVILPTFRFMATWGLQYGWVIALLTVFVKLITSPIMYKQFRQSAMMKVLKPDMDEISKKYPNKDDAMKKQQEVMKLYRTAGVNPLAGCLPALLQIPIFYALFNFFPNIIDLRGKGFLWADDLTAYDAIIDLPFEIPFYGAHISLFALLYVITMVIYFRFSGTNIPRQEGMPDMRIIMYIMPVMFIFFLNSYASGLSWYYFVSNAINIGLVLIIKNFMIDEDKIHQKIQANKAKPSKKRKKSKWASRLEEAMKKAQEQQEQQKKNKRK